MSGLLGKQVRRLRVAVICLAAAVVVLLALVVDIYVQRGQARDYYNQQIHDLACLAVKDNPDSNRTIRVLRASYQCPPYATPGHRHVKRRTAQA